MTRRISKDKARLVSAFFLNLKKSDQVYVPNYCSSGCNIFVSVPANSNPVAQKITIQAFQGNPIRCVFTLEIVIKKAKKWD